MGSQRASVGGRSREFILFMMTLVYVVNYLDRTVLAIVLPEIKHEFQLSDAVLGFLSGTSFAITYATLGMPLAWIADRSNRRNVIAGSVALFSAMTLLCAFTSNTLQLIVARILTGVGEAGTGPSIQSIISDLYPPTKRGAALAVYSSGTNIGLLLAFIGGGLIAEQFGWRIAFLAAGLPGIFLSIIVISRVPEPRRGHVEQINDDATAPTFFATVTFLWSQRSFRWIAMGAAMSAFAGYAVVTFVPLFLSVSHGMRPSPRGLVLALLTGIGGGFGTIISGLLVDRLSPRDVRWNTFLPVVFVAIAIPFIPFFYLSPGLLTTLLFAVVPLAMSSSYLAPCLAMTQGLVPLRMRAQAAAILFFILNIIGGGLGPLCVGMLSDALHPLLGSDSIRWALLATTIPLIASAWCFWNAGRTLTDDLSRGAGAKPQRVPT